MEFVAQWLSRLASKRNDVGTNLIVGKIFFHFENLACFAVPRSFTPSKYPVYQGFDYIC